MREKRRDLRINEENRVKIRLASKDDEYPDRKLSFHMTKDLSKRGIKILSNTFLPVNRTLRVELSVLNPPRMISALGKIRWIKSRYTDDMYEIGIEFVDMTPENIKILQEHIQKLLE